MPYTTGISAGTRNPGGYSRAQRTAHREFAQRIAELTDNGDDIAKALIEIADIGPNAQPDKRTNSPAEKRVRLDALALLTERYLGRVPQDVNLLVGEQHGASACMRPRCALSARRTCARARSAAVRSSASRIAGSRRGTRARASARSATRSGT